MGYLPLSSCYKESVAMHYRMSGGGSKGCCYLSSICNNIVHDMTTSNNNKLKEWACINNLNMLHLIRFIRYVNENYISIATIINIYDASIEAIETSISSEPLKDDDGNYFVVINETKLIIKSIAKKRSGFIDVVGDVFNHDFKDKLIEKNRLFIFFRMNGDAGDPSEYERVVGRPQQFYEPESGVSSFEFIIKRSEKMDSLRSDFKKFYKVNNSYT